MQQHLRTDTVGITALIVVSVAWIIFGLTFLLRKKRPGVQEAKRAPVSSLGILLQSVGFMFVWLIGRMQWWPFPPSFVGELVLAVVAILLAIASCLFCLLAVRTLGKQWTYRARVIEGHELITAGPYSVVRNPIYLGMFGMLLATGLVYSRWWNFLGAVVFFLIGNQIRIRAEEKLLRETFGSQFDDYARRVPAFLPRVL
jgi:protein-S-isoprenylcysteine O-methyltransferase Ste14